MISTSKFTAEMLRNLSKDYDENVFFSPYSIATAFAIVANGAKRNTADEMWNVLPDPNSWIGLSNIDTVNVANGIWLQDGISLYASYERLISTYAAEYAHWDFKNNAEGGRLEANRWAFEKTKERIKDLFPEGSMDDLTRLVIVNAIHFKDSWAEKFDKSRTVPDTFETPTGPVTVQMMKARKRKVQVLKGEDAFAVVLPYQNSALDMAIILPNHPSLRVPVENYLGSYLEDLNDRRMTGIMTLDLEIPKFKMETKYDLIPAMMQAGMWEVFTDNSDLSGISPDEPNLKIGAARHKAFVEVNEEGTEAAAATGIAVARCLSIEMTQTFRVDQPFIPVIRYNGQPVFTGRVVDPTK